MSRERSDHPLPATHVLAEPCLEHDNRPRTSKCLEGNFGTTQTQPPHSAMLSTPARTVSSTKLKPTPCMRCKRVRSIDCGLAHAGAI